MRHAVVIGAGSAGLASAVALRGKGFAVTVLERGAAPGQSWRERYDGLRLNTVRALSGLPGLGIPRRHGTWPRAGDFADYLASYAEHHGLPIRTRSEVVRVDQGWRVTVHTGEVLAADVVVVATGFAAEPVLPEWFHQGMLHATDYRNPEPFRGRRVLVVGAGNSGAEIAVELLGHAAEVTMSVRTPPLLIPSSPALQYLGALAGRLPAGLKDKASIDTHRRHYADLAAHGLPVPSEGAFTRFARDGQAPTAERGLANAVRSGRIRIVPAVKDVADGVVRLADGAELLPDAVIAATGYRPAHTALLGHLDPAAPGLFVVGAPSVDGGLREHATQADAVAAACERNTDG